MNYEIKGGNLPVVICNLEKNETMFNESGAMSWMSPNMEMKTVGGGIGKVFGRMFSGESLFQNQYTAKEGPGMIAFASSFPGSIKAVDIRDGNGWIIQKSGFLAAEMGVDLSIYLQKKISGGFFGGEGFIMQKLSGEGIAFLEIDGAAIEYDLDYGESLVVNTGYVAAMSASCKMDIQIIKGVKNVFLGGEGIFNTTVTGPGPVILQSMPIASTALELYRYMPHPSNN